MKRGREGRGRRDGAACTAHAASPRQCFPNNAAVQCGRARPAGAGSSAEAEGGRRGRGWRACKVRVGGAARRGVAEPGGERESAGLRLRQGAAGQCPSGSSCLGAALCQAHTQVTPSGSLGSRLLLGGLSVEPGADQGNGGTDLGLGGQLVAEEQHCGQWESRRQGCARCAPPARAHVPCSAGAAARPGTVGCEQERGGKALVPGPGAG